MDWNQIKASSCDMSSPVVAGTDIGGDIENDPASTFFAFFNAN